MDHISFEIMEKNGLMAAVVCLSGIVVSLCGCIGETEGEVVVMSAWEFYNNQLLNLQSC